jgi:NTP pyrophosphatase (non-canonical NTP hydrolase)
MPLWAGAGPRARDLESKEGLMNIDAYARWAAGTGGVRGEGNQDPRELSYLGLGLAGEAGEVAGELKKLLRDGRSDPARLAEELGDVIYYWARLCVAVGVVPGELLDRSRAKIEARLAQAGRP